MFIAANSWLFVKLVAPAGVLGYVSVVVGENKALEIARSLLQFPAGDILLHRSEMLQLWLARLTGYFVSWIAFCIAFGGISSATRQIAAESIPSVSDSFAEVRRCIAPFLRLSLLLFLLLLVAASTSSLLFMLFWVLHRGQVHLSHSTFQVIEFAIWGLALLALSRFGLAIPSSVLDNCRGWQAIFRSDELTEEKWCSF